MKKMMKDIRILAAFLLASVSFAACSTSDNNIIEKQPVNPTEKVYTMTIQATKGGASRDQSRAGSIFGETQPALDEVKSGDEAMTRALSLDETGTKNVLNALLEPARSSSTSATARAQE